MIHSSVHQLTTTNTYTSDAPWAPGGEGDGFIVDGVVTGLSYATVYDKPSSVYVRYVACVVEVEHVVPRRFQDGKEIEHLVSAAKAERSGFLNKTEKTAAKEFEVPVAAFLEQCRGSRPFHLPSVAAPQVEFWIPKQEYDRLELRQGQKVRLRTLKNSLFTETIGKVESGVSRAYAGDGVGDAWTAKLAAAASRPAPEKKKDENPEVKDEEWD